MSRKQGSFDYWNAGRSEVPTREPSQDEREELEALHQRQAAIERLGVVLVGETEDEEKQLRGIRAADFMVSDVVRDFSATAEFSLPSAAQAKIAERIIRDVQVMRETIPEDPKTREKYAMDQAMGVWDKIEKIKRNIDTTRQRMKDDPEGVSIYREIIQKLLPQLLPLCIQQKIIEYLFKEELKPREFTETDPVADAAFQTLSDGEGEAEATRRRAESEVAPTRIEDAGEDIDESFDPKYAAFFGSSSGGDDFASASEDDWGAPAESESTTEDPFASVAESGQPPVEESIPEQVVPEEGSHIIPETIPGATEEVAERVMARTVPEERTDAIPSVLSEPSEPVEEIVAEEPPRESISRVDVGKEQELMRQKKEKEQKIRRLQAEIDVALGQGEAGEIPEFKTPEQLREMQEQKARALTEQLQARQRMMRLRPEIDKALGSLEAGETPGFIEAERIGQEAEKRARAALREAATENLQKQLQEQRFRTRENTQDPQIPKEDEAA